MSKPIKTSTYMNLNDVVSDALDAVYRSHRNPEYRVLVKMALQDFVRNAAHDIPEEKAIKLIDKMQNEMLKASAAEVLGETTA